MPLTPWEPILPVADVMALREAIGYVKRKRDKRGRTVSAERNAGTREKHADYLLAGIVECSGCHRPMTPRKHRGERAYVCPSKHRGQACTTGALVMAAIAEEDVEAEYLGEFGNVPRTEIVETKNNEAGTAELDAAISDIATEMTRPGADVPALAETLTELHARRAEVSTAPATRTTVLHDDTIGEWWATAGTVEKRKMLRSAIESALVVPGVRGKRTKRVRIDWERDDWMGYDD